jgi:23S rRNA (guanosine2251-2'-O)-methyltransferase
VIKTEKSTRPLVIFGVNAVMEKLKSSPEQVFEVLVVESRERAGLTAVIEEARRRGLPVRYVHTHKLNALTEGGLHQGVAATAAPYVYSSFTELLEAVRSAPVRILILDGLTDPRNFGALLRSAEGAGVRHVVTPKDRAVGVTPAVIKTSAGAVNYVKIYRVPNLTRALQALKQAGCWIVGLDAAASECVYDRDYPDSLAVVLGAEGEGIRPLVRRQCDFLVSLPMRGKVASLNVSVAGGIFLYELARQGRGP